MKYMNLLSTFCFLFSCTSEDHLYKLPESTNNQHIDTLVNEDTHSIYNNNWYKPNLDSQKFSSGSFLYWQFNSDSSWLTFETPKGKKAILNSDHMGYWDRIGMKFIKEYEQYLLFIHEWVSGCCQMPDFILINKNNAQEILRISSQLAIYASDEEDFILYFKEFDMINMVYLDLKAYKSYHFNMQEFNLQETANEIGFITSSDYDMFIDYPKHRDSQVSIVFRHLPKNESGDYKKDSVVFVKN